MRKVLVLRSGGAALPGVDTIVTHTIRPVPAGIAEALAFEPDGAFLVITSRTTVEILAGAGAIGLLARPFALRAAAGHETARAMTAAGAKEVLVPSAPGAAGIVEALSSRAVDRGVLWPRGSDADPAGLAPLSKAGALLEAPVVYEKLPTVPDRGILAAFQKGAYDAVAVSSLAALDVFLEALGRPETASLPAVQWGVLGPETARTLVARGFPAPLVPGRARLADLIAALQ